MVFTGVAGCSHDVDTSGKLSKDTGGLVSAASKEHKEKVAREQEEERQRQSKLQKLRGGPTAAGSSNRARKSKILDKEVHEKPEGGGCLAIGPMWAVYLFLFHDGTHPDIETRISP